MKVLLFARGAIDRQRWVDFPLGAPNIESDGLRLLESISYIPQWHRQGQLLVGDIESPVANLKNFVPQDSTPEELNTLAIKLKYLNPEALVCFEVALELNDIKDMKDILRTADTLDQYDMFLDVSTMGELGRYLVSQGIVEFPDEVCPYLDFEKIGIEYNAEHAGMFCGTSYVTVKEDAQGPQMLDADRAQVFTVHLYTSKVGDTMPGPYRLTLPASEERLEQVKQLIGVEEFSQAHIEQVEYPLTQLADCCNVDCPSVEMLNELAEEVEALLKADKDIRKLCAVLEAERPQTFEAVLRFARDLDDYECFNCGCSAEEYGRYVLDHAEALDIEILEDLEGFIDESAYGRYRMKEDGVRETSWGLLRRYSEPFPAEEQGMNMR